MLYRLTTTAALLLGLLLGTLPTGVVSQPPPAASPTAGPPNPNAGCDPYATVCQDELSLDCGTNPARTGSVQIISPPEKGAYQYIDSPINITWAYMDSEPRFPRFGASIYYKAVQDKEWRLARNVSRGSRSQTWNMPTSPPGTYEIWILPDNVNMQAPPGNKVSCIAEGFPIISIKRSFRLLPLPSVPVINPTDSGAYGPSRSAGTTDTKTESSLWKQLTLSALAGAALFYLA